MLLDRIASAFSYSSIRCAATAAASVTLPAPAPVWKSEPKYTKVSICSSELTTFAAIHIYIDMLYMELF
jgi:hypothetical protein